VRRIIVILIIVAPVLYVLANVAYFAFATLAGHQDQHTINEVFGVIANVILIGGAAMLGVALILGLIDAARRRLWGWFAFILLVPYFGNLIYVASGPQGRTLNFP